MQQSDHIAHQNRRLFEIFWTQNYRALLRTANWLCRGRHDGGEDLVSQATLRLIQMIETSDRPFTDIHALFRRTLHNLAIDQHRSARRADQIHDRSVDPHDDRCAGQVPATGDPHAQLAARQELASVQHRVARLPEESRTLFRDRFLEERSYREIAHGLEISEALARKRIQHLRLMIAAPACGEADPAAPSRTPTPDVYPSEAA